MTIKIIISNHITYKNSPKEATSDQRPLAPLVEQERKSQKMIRESSSVGLLEQKENRNGTGASAWTRWSG